MHLRCLCALTLLLAAAQAQSATVSYYLDQTNASPGLADGVPYAQVSIDDDTAGAITFTISALSPLTSVGGSGFGFSSFGFNVVGSGAGPLSDASGSNAQWALPNGWSVSVAPPNNKLDGFGRFDVDVRGSGSALPSFTFALKGTSLTLASFQELATGNVTQGPAYFAAHVVGLQTVSGGGAYFGGMAPVVPVPLPAPLALLALGVVSVLGSTPRRDRAGPVPA